MLTCCLLSRPVTTCATFLGSSRMTSGVKSNRDCLKCCECSVPVLSSTDQLHSHPPICSKCNEDRVSDYFSRGTTCNSGHFTYKLEEIFAHGGMGTVHKAKIIGTTQDLRIPVKIIMLSSDPTTAKQQRDTLEPMVKNWTGLSHIHLVRHYDPAVVHLDTANVPQDVYHDYSDSKYFHIPMEYCSGGTLHSAAQYFIPSKTVLKWIKEIADGLKYLHRNRVVHRDLKPTNILLSATDYQTCVMKIGDLGEMKQLMEEVTQRGEATSYRGTVCYMSPEMISGDGNPFPIGKKTDIWSFGCVFIHLLTGRLEFVKAEENGTARIIKGSAVGYYVANGGRPQIPGNIPEQLAHFITSCFYNNPEQRPKAAELYDSLTVIADDISQWPDMRPVAGLHIPLSEEFCPFQ